MLKTKIDQSLVGYSSLLELAAPGSYLTPSRVDNTPHLLFDTPWLYLLITPLIYHWGVLNVVTSTDTCTQYCVR